LSGPEFSARLKERGVLINSAYGVGRLRLLTHFDVDRAACARAVEAVREVAAGGR
jgi:hypothetical protein